MTTKSPNIYKRIYKALHERGLCDTWKEFNEYWLLKFHNYTYVRDSSHAGKPTLASLVVLWVRMRSHHVYPEFIEVEKEIYQLVREMALEKGQRSEPAYDQHMRMD